MVVTPDNEPFIDLVQIRGVGLFGTGLLVGRGLVLTALHCVRDPKNGWRIFDDIGVYPLRELQHGKERSYAAHIVWPSTDTFGEDPPDVAVLEIADPDLPEALVSRRFGELPRIPTTGYARGFPKATSGSQLPGGRIEHNQPGRVTYTSQTRRALTIDATGRHELESRERWAGMSGGPLLINDLIIGVMRNVPEGWKGEAVEAEPLAPLLRNDPSLRSLLGVELPLVTSTEHVIYNGPAYARSPYRAEVEPLLKFHMKNFVGRGELLAQMLAFARQSEAGYLVLTADAGQGKSSLAAKFLHDVQSGRSQTAPLVACFFVREHGQRNTATAFLRAVNSQLLDALGLPGGVPLELQPLRDQLIELWSRCLLEAHPDRPLLLLVDALDEMAQEGPRLQDILPATLGPYAHVILTSRLNPDPFEDVTPEHPMKAAHVLALQNLSSEDIERLLIGFGASKPSAALWHERIWKRTGGQPLLSRFVAEDVARSGEAALRAMERAPPAGVVDYFQQQFRLLAARAATDLTWDVLGLLAVAKDSLSLDDFSGILAVARRMLGKAVDPIRRYLIGEQSFQLMHENLRSPLQREMGDPTLAKYEARLLAWCDGYRAKGWPNETPAYVLRHFSDHAAGRPEMLTAVFDKKWMDLHLEKTHSLEAFSRGVLQATTAARDAGDVVATTKGLLISATLQSVAQVVPAEALALLVHLGRSGTALGLASINNTTDAWIAVGTALIGVDERLEAMDAFERALTIAAANKHDPFISWQLPRLLSALRTAGFPDAEERVAAIARSIGSDETREDALKRLHEPSAVPTEASFGSDEAQLRNTVAEALAALDAGNTAEALDRLRSVFSRIDEGSVWMYPYASAELLYAVARYGDQQAFDRLLQIFEADANRAPGYLATAAATFVRGGLRQQGLDLVDRAKRRVEAEQGYSRGSTLAELASVLHQADEEDAAVALLEQTFMPSASFALEPAKLRALLRSACALGELGQRDRGLAIADWIIDGTRLIQKAAAAPVLGQAAVIIATLGDHTRAAQLAESAVTLTGELDRSARGMPLAAAALGFGLACRPESLGTGLEARSIILERNNFQPVLSAGQAFARLGGLLVRLGEPMPRQLAANSLAAARAIDNAKQRLRAICQLVPTLVRSGLDDLVQCAADHAERSAAEVLGATASARAAAGNRFTVHCQLALLRQQAGLPVDGEEAARTAHLLFAALDTLEGEALRVLVELLVAFRMNATLQELAQSIDRSKERSRELGVVALAFASLGDTEAARALADEMMLSVKAILDQAAQSVVLSDIAGAIGTICGNDGLWQALRIVARFYYPHDAARALTALLPEIVRCAARETSMDALTGVKNVLAVRTYTELGGEAAVAAAYVGRADLAFSYADEKASVSPPAPARILARMAEGFHRFDLKDHAATAIAKAVASAADDPIAHIAIAAAYEAMSQLEPARESARRAVAALSAKTLVETNPEELAIAGEALALVSRRVHLDPILAATELLDAQQQASVVAQIERGLARSGESMPVPLQADALQPEPTRTLLSLTAGNRDRIYQSIGAVAEGLADGDSGETLWHLCRTAVEVDRWWRPELPPLPV